MMLIPLELSIVTKELNVTRSLLQLLLTIINHN